MVKEDFRFACRAANFAGLELPPGITPEVLQSDEKFRKSLI
jgi:hypothetical protein